MGAANQVIWLCKLLGDLGFKLDSPIEGFFLQQVNYCHHYKSCATWID